MARGAYGPKQRLTKRVILSLVAVLAVVAGLYLISSALEKRDAKQETRGDLTNRFDNVKTVLYNGGAYRQRDSVSSILLMGVDKSAGADASGFRSGGQADFLMLLTIDSARKTITPLEIDRDTMTPITILGVLGNAAGTRTAQISLSHGFGDGGKMSCELTRDAVTRLLLGQEIEYYVSMSLDGISALNDWVGGVTVTLEDDFTAFDPAMEKGATITLQGDQAEYFVRGRMQVGVGTNEARMKRRRAYVKGLAELLDERIQKDANCVGELFDTLSPYLVTDMKRGRMINVAWNTREYGREETLDIKGEHQIGEDGFMEFRADDAALEAMVIDLFYEPPQDGL